MTSFNSTQPSPLLASNFTRELCINQESWGSAITTVAAAVIVVGNLLVILVLIKFRGRRFRPLNWFIVQMAVADLGVGILLLWIGTFTRILLETVTLMSSIFVYGSLAFTTSTSTLGVTFIAIDRYFYIIKHSRYKSIMTRRKVALAIGLAFVVPFTVFILGPSLGWNCIDTCDCRIYNTDPSAQYCFGAQCSQMMTPFRSATVLVGGVSLLFLLAVSIALYTRIFHKVHFQRNCAIHRSRKKSELRMIKTMLIVLSGFVLTTGPLAVCCFASYLHNVRELHFIMRILVIISTVNSILNPFFYFWRIPDMYKNLCYMLRTWLICCLPCCKERCAPPSRRKVSGVALPGISQSKRPGKRPSESSLTWHARAQGKYVVSQDILQSDTNDLY